MKCIPLLLLTLLFFLNKQTAFAQIALGCDTVYILTETIPMYEKGDAEATKYLLNEVAPVVSSYNKKNDALVTKVHIDLIINQQGNVVDVEFPNSNISSEFEFEIKQKLLKMKGWKAGIMNGEPVCCRLSFPISCILYK
ncbi:hypothetical protein ACSX1A_11460 [Pontibacter sp. MBLB2868]|uniref:hypothetical protein n=1 Tax=Pontibacter sp. MBLB2868 TaxID=3451555 RepID=UPI003F7519E1